MLTGKQLIFRYSNKIPHYYIYIKDIGKSYIMPHKVYTNQVTWCCFLVNFFIAHKAQAIFVSSYGTQAESYVHLWSIRHKLSRKVTADDLKMAIARSLLRSEINFKTKVPLPLNNKVTITKLLKLWGISPSNYMGNQSVNLHGKSVRQITWEISPSNYMGNQSFKLHGKSIR